MALAETNSQPVNSNEHAVGTKYLNDTVIKRVMPLHPLFTVTELSAKSASTYLEQMRKWKLAKTFSNTRRSHLEVWVQIVVKTIGHCIVCHTGYFLIPHTVLLKKSKSNVNVVISKCLMLFI